MMHAASQSFVCDMTNASQGTGMRLYITQNCPEDIEQLCQSD